MKIVNGAEPPKNKSGEHYEVNEEIFNMCTECGEELDPSKANDAFGTEWATCEACLDDECEDCQ